MTEEITKQLELLGNLAIEGKKSNHSYITERTHLLTMKSQRILEEIESLKTEIEDNQTSQLFNMHKEKQEILSMEIKASTEKKEKAIESSINLKQSIKEAEEKLKRQTTLLNMAIENESEIIVSKEDQEVKEQKLKVSKDYTNSISKGISEINDMISGWKLDIQENEAKRLLSEANLITKNSELEELNTKIEAMEYKPLSPEEQETNKLLLAEKEASLSTIKGETEFLLTNPELVLNQAKEAIANNAEKEVVEGYLNQLQRLSFEEENFTNRLNDLDAVIASKSEIEEEIKKIKETIKTKNYYDKRAANKDKKEKKILEELIKNGNGKEKEKAEELENLEKRREILSQTISDYQKMATMYEEDRANLLNNLSDPKVSGKLTIEERDAIYKKLADIDVTLKLGLTDRLTFVFKYNAINQEIESIKSEQKILLQTNQTNQNNLQKINNRVEKNTYVNTRAKNKDKSHLKDLQERLVSIEKKGTNLALSTEAIKQQIMKTYVPNKNTLDVTSSLPLLKPQWRARKESESKSDYRAWKYDHERQLVEYYKATIIDAKTNIVDKSQLCSIKKTETEPIKQPDFDQTEKTMNQDVKLEEITSIDNDFDPAQTPIEVVKEKSFGKRVIIAIKNIPKKIWEIISLKKVRDNIRLKLLSHIENGRVKNEFDYSDEEKKMFNEAFQTIQNNGKKMSDSSEIEQTPVLGLNEIYNTIKEIVEVSDHHINKEEMTRRILYDQLEDSCEIDDDIENSYKRLKQKVTDDKVLVKIDTDYVASDEVDPKMNEVLGITSDRPSQFAVITKKLYDTVIDKYGIDLEQTKNKEVDSTPKSI